MGFVAFVSALVFLIVLHCGKYPYQTCLVARVSTCGAVLVESHPLKAEIVFVLFGYVDESTLLGSHSLDSDCYMCVG
jgi:hypothetical protein